MRQGLRENSIRLSHRHEAVTRAPESTEEALAARGRTDGLVREPLRRWPRPNLCGGFARGNLNSAGESGWPPHNERVHKTNAKTQENTRQPVGLREPRSD